MIFDELIVKVIGLIKMLLIVEILDTEVEADREIGIIEMKIATVAMVEIRVSDNVLLTL